MTGGLAAWQRAAADAALLRDAAALDAPAASDIERLRRGRDPAVVSAALELTAARRSAAAKFGERARSIFADREGVEMASSLLAGAHKAGRFRDAGVAEIDDLCCGIGADAMALTDAGLGVSAVDLDPVRAWMASRNLGRPAETADVEQRPPSGRPIHIDPSRRTGGRRSWRLRDIRPGPDAVRRLCAVAPAWAVKLGPGVDPGELWDGELEFISERGRLTQAVLWGGMARSGARRRATLLPSGEALAGEPSGPPAAPLDRFVHTPDPGAERAGLLGRLCADFGLGAALHPALALLTGPAPIESPWLRGFEVIEHMSWSERRVRAWLRAHDAGVVTVKTRGKAVEPDALQRRLRGDGAAPFVLFVLRAGSARHALITLAVPPPPSAPPPAGGPAP